MENVKSSDGTAKAGKVLMKIALEEKESVQIEKDSAAIAKRKADQLRFRMKEAMAQRGGSEAFLSWLRTGAMKNEAI
jgi:hypothetical protein